jgi:5-methylcytosine-specific restriction endonuclease McrA
LEEARRELDAMDGRMLSTMDRLRIFHRMQFLDLGHYSEERMGMGRSTARRLRWIERYMHDLPEARAAYYQGEIGIAKVVQLVRVRGAWNRGDWVERAKQVTVRRLEQEVQLVLRRVALHESGLLPLSVGRNPWELFPEGEDLVRSASALNKIARKAATLSGPAVTIRCSIESEALELWNECVDRCRELFGRNLPEWECANRFIDAFFAAYEQEDSRKYALNHKVFERDGWRCTVPGCGCRSAALHAHHVVPRSKGGPDTMPNETAVCSVHHSMAIHEGTVEVDGEAPNCLFWRLGVNEDGEALLTVGPGERIV